MISDLMTSIDCHSNLEFANCLQRPTRKYIFIDCFDTICIQIEILKSDEIWKRALANRFDTVRYIFLDRFKEISCFIFDNVSLSIIRISFRAYLIRFLLFLFEYKNISKTKNKNAKILFWNNLSRHWSISMSTRFINLSKWFIISILRLKLSILLAIS